MTTRPYSLRPAFPSPPRNAGAGRVEHITPQWMSGGGFLPSGQYMHIELENRLYRQLIVAVDLDPTVLTSAREMQKRIRCVRLPAASTEIIHLGGLKDFPEGRTRFWVLHQKKDETPVQVGGDLMIRAMGNELCVEVVTEAQS